MWYLWIVVIVLFVVAVAASTLKVVKEYGQGVSFRLGRVMAHLPALQLLNRQTLVQRGVDKDSTVVFPAPLMNTIGQLGWLLACESSAALAAPPHEPTNNASAVDGTPLPTAAC